MTTLSRRQALVAGATMPLAATFLPQSVRAQETMQGSGFAPWNRFKLGGFEVTTLLAGTRAGDKPQETFGTNATPEDFAALSAANFIPADMTQNFFTPTVVNTGAEIVLFRHRPLGRGHPGRPDRRRHDARHGGCRRHHPHARRPYRRLDGRG